MSSSITIHFKLAVCILTATILFVDAAARAKQFLTNRQIVSEPRGETNPLNFVRLVMMRLIYGIASSLGFGEGISNAFNGAFVPPGVDDYDDYGDALDY